VNFERGFAPQPFREAAPRAQPEPIKDIAVTANLQQSVDRLILGPLSPAGVLINAQMDVLQFRGNTGAFLEHHAGSASLNLLKMVRE